MAENQDDLLEPEDKSEEPSEGLEDEDDEPRWGGEESLGLLPPD
jgi:hypothetical protein